MLLNERKKLEGSARKKIITALEVAGWYNGRNVDISPFEEYYNSHGLTMFESSRNFFKEFYGIATRWAFTFKGNSEPTNALNITFTFHLFPCDYDKYFGLPADEYYNDEFKSEYCNAVQETAQQELNFIGKIGYYYPAFVWIDNNGKLYVMHDYNRTISTFNSIVELIERELEQHDLDYVTVKL